ncbi:Uncharacterized protein PECH_005913 [Penicillium ucsense]|uniref:Uncharacterized protein n=1 Tax=Penicillium ucsense TaxID=2839758 RepID=A0A8J8WJ17_9EURO|nr:Uncharacterized protein PECM_002115 [Penicillium ucsense]KAF7735990.1 Uncharacterized protein PECH_005913 [Penicillium ucsense]
MSEKRKPSMSEPASKRPRLNDSGDRESFQSIDNQERPKNDPTFGQKSAFPGLDDGGDELFYGSADDGIEYLRMVRSEAKSLPSLFTAPTARKRDEDVEFTNSVSDGMTDKHKFPAGFYEDEAYIAPPTADKQPIALLEDGYPDAQLSYYNLLRHRFIYLRSTLRCIPPASAIAALDDAHPISLPDRSTAARKEWRRLLLTEEPTMVQLACLDSASVLRVLTILARGLGESVRGGDAALVRRVGAWAWGLLAKCREVGELATDQVGEIRDLGKRAAKILLRIREAELKRSNEDSDEYDSDTGGDSEEAQADAIMQDESDSSQHAVTDMAESDADMVDADLSSALEAAKSRLQAQLDEDAAAEQEDRVAEQPSGDSAQQARILLDMILTVVGEFFGQRDLLELREVWVLENAHHETVELES